jgi:SAM-dependent methyltransferase
MLSAARRRARRHVHAAGRASLPAHLRDLPESVVRHFVGVLGYEIATQLRRMTPTGVRVLVVGPGTGRDVYFLGLENDVVALDLVAQATVPDAIIADFSREIPLPDASVGAVVISDVLEHVFDDLAALRNCRRVLADDGCLVLNVPYGDDLGDHHVRVYTRSTARRLLAAAGFRVVEEVERGPIAHLDRYRPFQVAWHGFHMLRHWTLGDAGYWRTLERVARIDRWFGRHRIAPTSITKRHGAFLKAVKATPRDFVDVNRAVYREQGAQQMRTA